MRYILLLLILFFICLAGCSIKDCKTDINCFIESAKYCSKARVNIIHDETNIKLTSRGVWFEKCKISLKIEEVGGELVQQNPTIAKLAIGKTLNCAIPMEIINYNNSEYINEILNFDNKFDMYCSGPIKDVLQGPLKNVIKDKISLE